MPWLLVQDEQVSAEGATESEVTCFLQSIASRCCAHRPGERHVEDSTLMESAIQSHSIDKRANCECQVRMAGVAFGRQTAEVPGTP